MGAVEAVSALRGYVKKLCFTARLQDLLARHLRRLAHAAVGDVWAQYKSHPSLFCTVQDDDFTNAYRARCAKYDEAWIDEDESSCQSDVSSKD